MLHLLYALLATARSSLKPQRELALENLALRQQLAILQRKTKRPKLSKADRAFWVALCRLWPDWHNALIIVKPQTVIGWHRKGFKLYWTWKSRRRGGRPPIDAELRTLIRRIASENPTWGAPRIHGELLMLGFEVGEATVSLYMPRLRKPPSHSWRVSPKPHPRPRFHRLLCRAHSNVSRPVRIPRARARAPTYRVLQRNRCSVRAVDRPAIGQRLPRRLGAEVHHPGPRQDLWRELRSSSAYDGNRAGSHRAAVSMAESVLRARDRYPSAGCIIATHDALPDPKSRSHTKSGVSCAHCARPRRMPRSIRACRTVGNARRGPSSVRWVTFAIIAAHISPADNVLRNDTLRHVHGSSLLIT